MLHPSENQANRISSRHQEKNFQSRKTPLEGSETQGYEGKNADNIDGERGEEPGQGTRSWHQQKGPEDARRGRTELTGIDPVMAVSDLFGEAKMDQRVVKGIAEV